MPNRSPILLALALPVALLVAACSSTTGASVAPAASAQPTAAATAAAGGGGYGNDNPSQAPASAATGGSTVSLADSSLGKVLVAADGRTLYGFKADAAGTPTCADACAKNWPALIATGAVTAGSGLDASKLTTVDRPDGTKQVKYGDWPLYYFAGDKAAGDVNGQGKGDVWYVVGADAALMDAS